VTCFVTVIQSHEDRLVGPSHLDAALEGAADTTSPST
jgi:hypothetical protein